MLIAQITDMHIKPLRKLAYGRVDTSAYLERCVAHLNALAPRPDVVLATGDLVHSGAAEEYANLRALLQPLEIPLYLIPGNHDDRERMRETFPDHAYLTGGEGFLHYTLEAYPLRLIALDTLLPGEGKGLFCEERLAWLSERLREQPERPTVLFMHHPPFSTGIAYMDGMGLEGAEAMAGVVAGHSNIQRILCGHLHRAIQTLWAGTLVSCAPSPAHQVALELGEADGGNFILEPPACHLHLWRPGEGLITHLSFIGDFDGPYPFRPKAEPSG
jgi:3',5'-cyclic AMP phosphodiesterase CpdA